MDVPLKKTITMDTGIMQKMVSGDCVMVDKGFKIDP